MANQKYKSTSTGKVKLAYDGESFVITKRINSKNYTVVLTTQQFNELKEFIKNGPTD